MKHELAKAGRFELHKLDGEVVECCMCFLPINHGQYMIRCSDQIDSQGFCGACANTIGALYKVLRCHQLGMAGNRTETG